MNMENFVALIGWIGVSCCTIGFLLLNLKLISFDSWKYQMINIVGGLGLVTSALYFRDLPNITSNSMWVIIAGFGLYKSFNARKQVKRKKTLQMN